MSEYVRWLKGFQDDQAPEVGGKAANLGRMVRVNLPVPPAFVLTTHAYRAFINANGFAAETPDLLRARIPTAAVPEDVREALLQAYHELGEGRVAVRSSGTAEDTASASFAGQHDTFLDVDGANALLDAVRGCWLSLWSERAVDYRRQRHWDEQDLAIAVVVQTMVPAEWAGVLFTADPVSGRRDHLVVEAVPGLGEALVSGTQTGVHVAVHRPSGRLLEGHWPLPDVALVDLTGLAQRVEREFGSPQDIEWAYAGGRLYLLQARPITTLPEPSQPSAASPQPAFTNLQRRAAPNLVEHMPRPIYPFDYSLVFRPAVERGRAALAGIGLELPPVDTLFLQPAEGVYQLVPPARIRPRFPTVLALPFRIAGALLKDHQAWMTEQQRTTVALAQQFDAADLTALTDRDLLEGISSIAEQGVAAAPARFGLLLPRMLLSRFATPLLRRLAPDEAEQLETDLLAGIPTMTNQANQALAGLAATIRRSPALLQTFQAEPPDRLAAALATTTEGQAVVQGVDQFLEAYGARETVMISAAFPAWRDDPSLVYGLLKGLVQAPEPAAEPADRPAAARQRLQQLAGRRMFGLGGPLAGLAVRLTEVGRGALTFRENSHSVMVMPLVVIRRLALELGTRLVARGALDRPEDVFLLHFEELAADLPADHLRATAARRRDARGPEGHHPPMPAALLATPPSEGDLRGQPASAGQAAGPVRVILTEAEFWKLRPGDVLVAPYTNPTWTPLFTIACAVVVDVGGAASHAAIVAREVGIPAVMATGDGTRRLRDGQRVVVDGNQGTVRLLSELPAASL